jgi:inosine-uridine nucleoside N-ribohydrolase
MTDTSRKIPVIIDTDPGADDTAAIMWVLANNRFDVKAVTVALGNVCMERGAANALKVLDVCGRTDIPVYLGWENLAFSKATSEDVKISSNGSCGSKSRRAGAPYEMIRIAGESKVPVTILALAPLTNIAHALLTDNDFKNRVEQVIFMGSLKCASRPASFNGDFDPDAVKLVYVSGVRITEIGPDVCDKVLQTEAALSSIASAGTRVTDYLIKVLDRTGKCAPVKRSVMNRPELMSLSPDESVCLHDLACAAYLIEPEWFKTRRLSAEEVFPGPEGVHFSGRYSIFRAFDADGSAAMARWVSDMRSFNTALFERTKESS